MTWTFTTSGAALFKAGIHANISGAALEAYKDQAEGRIESETHTAWIDNYSGLATGTKNILNDVASSLIAMKVIAYDTSGYLSREADTLMNMNDDIVNKGLKILSDKTNHTLGVP